MGKDGVPGGRGYEFARPFERSRRAVEKGQGLVQGRRNPLTLRDFLAGTRLLLDLARADGAVSHVGADTTAAPQLPLTEREVMLLAKKAGDSWGDPVGNIDVAAQRSLVRLSAVPTTAAEARAMFEALRQGQLRGIFVENQRAPALRAQAYGTWWGKLIPASEDAIVLLDRADSLTGAHMLVFRAAIKPNAPLLDAALLKAWGSFEALRQVDSQQSAVCQTTLPNVVSGEGDACVVLTNVYPKTSIPARSAAVAPHAPPGKLPPPRRKTPRICTCPSPPISDQRRQFGAAMARTPPNYAEGTNQLNGLSIYEMCLAIDTLGDGAAIDPCDRGWSFRQMELGRRLKQNAGACHGRNDPWQVPCDIDRVSYVMEVVRCRAIPARRSLARDSWAREASSWLGDKLGCLAEVPGELTYHIGDLLYAAYKENVTDPNHVAYVLGTARHEMGGFIRLHERWNKAARICNPRNAGECMEPDKDAYFERRYNLLPESQAHQNAMVVTRNGRRLYSHARKFGDGAKYYGRGHAQITFKTNYYSVGSYLYDTGEYPLLESSDFLVLHPEILEEDPRVQDPRILQQRHDIAARASVYGMKSGVFTSRPAHGHKHAIIHRLDAYDAPHGGYRWEAAREIIGVDEEGRIRAAQHARRFRNAMRCVPPTG